MTIEAGQQLPGWRSRWPRRSWSPPRYTGDTLTFPGACSTAQTATVRTWCRWPGGARLGDHVTGTVRLAVGAAWW